MLTFEQIKELVELVSSRRLHALELERAGFTLRISGEQTAVREVQVAVPAAAPAGQPAAAAPPAAAVVTAATQAAAAAPRSDLHVVTSPIVGTFYAAPSPDSPAFVKPGDRVRKGQVLCIVEAMKLMNEIECDADGVVAEIYPKNGQPVEYGEALFGLERA